MNTECPGHCDCVKELQIELANARSTIEAWNNPDIMKCGCKYNKVWGGTKWQHWFVPCKQHRAELNEAQYLRDRIEELAAELAKGRDILRKAEEECKLLQEVIDQLKGTI